MSVKFTIQNTASKAEKEGDTFIRFSGTSEPFSRHSERSCRKIGVDGGGNPKLVFVTGLDDKQVQFYSWYNDDEKKVVSANMKELKPLIEDFYGGPQVVDSSNYYFWKEDRNVNRLSLTQEDIGTFFDTEKPAHALLYLSIISGAFIDLVAPTKDWAERHQIPHYMCLESEGVYNDEDDNITKAEALAALVDLKANHGRDALFVLSWCVQYETNGFGAYNGSSPERDLMNGHIKYINGELVSKKKRNTPKVFLEYYEKWKGQQTRPLLYTEAYLKSGEYFSFVNQREKKYVTMDGTILGNTIDEAVKNLMKPKFTQDLEKLRDLVEAKWKE